MNDELLLLGLRIGASMALFAFVGTVGFMLWRDFRHAEKLLQERLRQRGKLVIMSTSPASVYQVGQSFRLLPLTSIGRAPTNAVNINEPYISSEHALISWRNGQWWIEDMNSSNGTRLNDVRITEPTVLSATDEIGLGEIRLRLELD